MLAMVIGKKHLEQKSRLAVEPDEGGPAKGQGAMKSAFSVQPQNVASAKVEELLQALLARFPSVPAPETIKKGTIRRKPGKRDTVIFAAILMSLKGIRYCSFLQDHGIKPRWADSGPSTYSKGYQIGDPWRKKVQDEKTRAKVRMNNYAGAQLATALNNYLPDEFDKIDPLLYSRNSPDASKSSTP